MTDPSVTTTATTSSSSSEHDNAVPPSLVTNHVPPHQEATTLNANSDSTTMPSTIAPEPKATPINVMESASLSCGGRVFQLHHDPRIMLASSMSARSSSGRPSGDSKGEAPATSTSSASSWGESSGALQEPLLSPLTVGSSSKTIKIANTTAIADHGTYMHDQLTKNTIVTANEVMTGTTTFGPSWTLSSPYWTLHSDIILTVTYRPAWQLLPEYTSSSSPLQGYGSSVGGSSFSSIWRTVATACQKCLHATCSANCCAPAAEVDFISETWTVHDIVQVQRLAEPLHITGAGECQALVVYLRPMQSLQDAPPMPACLQPAWDRQLHHILTHRQVLQRPPIRHRQDQQQASCDGKNPHFSGGMMVPDLLSPEEVAGEGVNLPPELRGGPVLTFCFPVNMMDPPLLWKVHFPRVSHALAVETLTVLDGRLDVGTENGLRPSWSEQLLESQQQQEQQQYYRPRPIPVPSQEDQGPQHPTHIYINGFQSWSFSGSVCRGREQPRSAMPALLGRAFNFGGSPPPVSTTFTQKPYSASRSSLRKQRAPFVPHYQSDFFTCITSDGEVPNWRMKFSDRKFPYQLLDEAGGPALLLGWLSQKEQFGVITANKTLSAFQMHASSHGQLLVPSVAGTLDTDWACAQLMSPHSYDEEPMVHYLHAVAAQNHARPLQNGSILTGWCSWYVFYEKINAGILRENFAQLSGMRKQVPTNVAVVDDGYMTAWGDWASLKPDAFPPPGLEGVARDIKASGMRPGLWMAPFAADKHSEVVKRHPNWIIRNERGVPANSANCGKFFYGLDATNPEVRNYIHCCVRRNVHEAGFNVLKIDFLYAACLHGNGRYDLSMSRAKAMHLAMATIREAAGPDVYLIGCGCPIASGIGFVDAMRVSADTGPTWYPARPLPWWDQGTLPALRSMVRNSISRAPMGHRWWHNDPDCIMLGAHTRLTDEEVASVASVVAMTCGMLLLSDDLPKVNPSRTRILSKIFPLTGVPAIVLDLHSTNDGLPSLMRLWCTDKHRLRDSFLETMSNPSSEEELDPNAEATYFARQISFNADGLVPPPNERKRSCIHVTKGLGTWTVVSISNWSDSSAIVTIPPHALLLPTELGWENDEADTFLGGGGEFVHGYHVFAFWSSRYSWLPDTRHASEGEAVSKRLIAHETEIYHIKPVTPDEAQYIGSDLHFTCGQEVHFFRATKNDVTIFLKTDYKRDGHIFVFIPRTSLDGMKVTVNGEPGRWTTVGNTPKVSNNGSPRLMGRVVSIRVVVHADRSRQDGQISIHF